MHCVGAPGGPAGGNRHMFVSVFLYVAIVLVVAWLLGFVVFHAAGGFLHILLVVAVIALIVHFIRGRP